MFAISNYTACDVVMFLTDVLPGTTLVVVTKTWFQLSRTFSSYLWIWSMVSTIESNTLKIRVPTTDPRQRHLKNCA